MGHISFPDVSFAPMAPTANPLKGLFSGGGAGFIYDASQIRLFQDAGAAVPVATDDDLIYRVNDKSGNASNGTQATSTLRPWFIKRRPAASLAPAKLGFFNQPDATGGAVGQGFTCTGLDFDGTNFINASHGQATAGAPSYQPILVKVSPAGVKLGEINLLSIDASLTSCQGVCVDDSDGSYFAAFPDQNKVWHISAAGAALGSFTIAGANGITYDSVRDRLWVMSATTLYRVAKDGTVEFSRTFIAGMMSGYDHIFHDAGRDIVWINGDVNGSTTGAMFPYHVGRNYFGSPLITFSDVTAIEGICIVGNTIYVNHDGYYHATTATIKKNQMQWYDASGFDAALAPPAGKPGARFGAHSGVPYALASPVNPSLAMTMMFSAFIEATGLTQIVMGCDSSTANTRAYFGVDATGKLVAGLGAQNLATIVASGGDRRRQLLTAFLRWDGTTVKMDIAGTGNVYSAAQSGAPNTNRFIGIGAFNNNNVSGFSNPMNGTVHMAAAINRAISDGEVLSVGAYAQQLWN